jgi:hypothetical protein
LCDIIGTYDVIDTYDGGWVQILDYLVHGEDGTRIKTVAVPLQHRAPSECAVTRSQSE